MLLSGVGLGSKRLRNKVESHFLWCRGGSSGGGSGCDSVAVVVVRGADSRWPSYE